MKNKIVAALLAFFLGSFGIHKFYLNQTKWGIAYLLFCWTYIPAIIAFFESIRFLIMSDEDFDLLYNKYPYLSPNNNLSEDLKALSDMYEKGHLTKEEFETKKSILLEKIK